MPNDDLVYPRRRRRRPGAGPTPCSKSTQRTAPSIRSTRIATVARPSKADPASMNPPAPSSPRAGDGKNHPGRPSNLARVVLAAHLRPRDVARAFGPCSSRCRSRKVEAGTSRPRKRRQPEVRQDGHDHLAVRDVGHDRPPPAARARENVHQESMVPPLSQGFLASTIRCGGKVSANGAVRMVRSPHPARMVA